MAIEKKKFGGITVSVCDCKDFDEVKTLYGSKLVGQFYKSSGSGSIRLIFISPHTATLREDSDEIMDWLKSLPVPSGVGLQISGTK